MKRILLAIIGIIAALLLIVTIIGFLYVGTIVKVGIEKFGPQIAKVPVTVDMVNVSLLSGTASIKNLVVNNPQGYKTPEAFKVGDVSVSLDTFSVTSNKILIHYIHVDAPIISFEQGLGGNNLSKLLGNINSSASNPQTPGNGQPAAGSGKPAPAQKIEIDDFLITNAKVDVGIAGVGSKLVPVPEIHLTDLGKDGDGLTPVEVTKAVLKAIISGTLQAVAGSVGNLNSTVSGLTGNLTSTLGSFFHK